MTESYNPLNKLNLGKSVAEALLDRPVDSLGELPSFQGAGIYALYYKGDFPSYKRMAQRNAEGAKWPIYIGKAIPAGGRRGASLFTDISGRFLFNRLRDHADSVQAASNLSIDDFGCRYLIVDDIWIPLGETLLISRFKPLWNLSLEGFGNHDPGAGRYNGFMPLWDVLHPGRSWAIKCRARLETSIELSARVEAFLQDNEPPDDPHMSFQP